MKHESKKLLRVFLANNKIDNIDVKMIIKEYRLIKKHEGNNFNYDCAFIAEALHNNYEYNNYNWNIKEFSTIEPLINSLNKKELKPFYAINRLYTINSCYLPFSAYETIYTLYTVILTNWHNNNYANNKEVSFFLIKFLKVVTIENLKKIALLTYNTPEKALKIISELGFIL